ncbi:hypothetical protein EX30DRAFT_49892 [Ascodesmis nigricans]|uniref:Uncharacterized protein n=1 Tax=Ascodesmis nigricans TaxID=341454 RepID=A0A4S2MVT0_9PEZI|nr:hypothetical protein EX30DRAFT_49892 [Ascodesmis nigricans]
MSACLLVCCASLSRIRVVPGTDEHCRTRQSLRMLQRCAHSGRHLSLHPSPSPPHHPPHMFLTSPPTHPIALGNPPASPSPPPSLLYSFLRPECHHPRPLAPLRAGPRSRQQACTSGLRGLEGRWCRGLRRGRRRSNCGWRCGGWGGWSVVSK